MTEFRTIHSLLDHLESKGVLSFSYEELRGFVYNTHALRIPRNMIASFPIPKQWGTFKRNHGWLAPESRVKALYGGPDGLLYVVTCENNVNKVHAISHKQDRKGLDVVSSFYVQRSWNLFNENKASGTYFKILGFQSKSDWLHPIVYAYLNYEDGHANVMGEHSDALYIGSRPYVEGSLQVFYEPDDLPGAEKSVFPSFQIWSERQGWEGYLQNLSLLPGVVINRMTPVETPSLWTSVSLSYDAQHQARPSALLVDKHPFASLYRWGSEKTTPWFTLLSPLFYDAELKAHCYWGYDITDPDNPRICLMKASSA